MVVFVDVSQHDVARRGHPLDWPQIAAAGLGGVMCARATYGDPRGFSPSTFHFGELMSGAKAAGYTARGGYHNLIRGDQGSIDRQVDYLRRELDRYGAEWAMCDVEAYEELRTRGLVPRWSDVQRFHDRWYSVDGRVMAWYIATWVWQGVLGSPGLSGLRGPLINANYKGGDGDPAHIYAAAGGDAGPGWKPYGSRVPDIWQYTSSANVPGASHSTDCNSFRGSRDELHALLIGDDDMAVDVTDIRAWMLEDVLRGRRVEEIAVALKAAADADAIRDRAVLAAVEALATGGGVESAPIVAAVNAVRDEARAEFGRLHQEIADANAQTAALKAELELALAHVPVS